MNETKKDEINTILGLDLANRIIQNEGYPAKDLNDDEINRLLQTYKLIIDFPRPKLKNVQILYKDSSYAMTIGTMVAKYQFGPRYSCDFGGISPRAGHFGITELLPYYFGKKNWILRTTTDAGVPIDEHEMENSIHRWLHAGILSGGTHNNMIRVLDNIAFVILGFADLTKLYLKDDDYISKISGYTWMHDGRDMPMVTTGTTFLSVDNPVVSLKTPLILNKESCFKFGLRFYEEPKQDLCIAPIGFAFVFEYVLRDLNDIEKFLRNLKIRGICEPT